MKAVVVSLGSYIFNNSKIGVELDWIIVAKDLNLTVDGSHFRREI